jgi:hypothetical protein
LLNDELKPRKESTIHSRGNSSNFFFYYYTPLCTARLISAC